MLAESVRPRTAAGPATAIMPPRLWLPTYVSLLPGAMATESQSEPVRARMLPFPSQR